MKRRVTLILAVMFVVSCGGPETTVTNYVNRNGSVLRKVEMQSSDNNFSAKVLRVPVDSTWKTTDSISISSDGDTTWYKFAEKLFESVDAINEAYLTDSGANNDLLRTAFFERRFKWFTTTVYYSESVGKSLLYGYPSEDYLSPEEIQFMNLPRKVMIEKLAGSDSLKFRELKDSLDSKSEIWLFRSAISEWIVEAGKLCESSGKESLTTAMLRSHEDDFNNSFTADSGFVSTCQTVLGEELCNLFRTELDSAENMVNERLDKSLMLDDYTMQVVMPARVISTNGYLLPEGEIAWPVTGNHMHTSDYLMYAEAQIINYWAIIFTLIFCAGFSLLIIQFRRR